MAEQQMSMAEIARALTRIEAKLDRSFSDHEARLRAAERTIWLCLGAGGLGTASGIASMIMGG